MMTKRKKGREPRGGSVKVFVSWSGPAAKRVANELRTWLPTVLQALDVFVSTKDIDKGVRWRKEIEEQLAEAHFGIVCLTPQNVEAPWIHFEAGALARALGAPDFEAPLFTYLIGVKHTDIRGPLAELQHTTASRDDTKILLQSLNKAVGEAGGNPIPEESLESLFALFWPRLESALAEALAVAPAPKGREPEDLLLEILEVVRTLEKQLPSTRRRSLSDYAQQTAKQELELADQIFEKAFKRSAESHPGTGQGRASSLWAERSRSIKTE